MPEVIVSIGANIGDREKNIRRAIMEMERYARVIKCSKPYRTRPYGKTDQPCFINMAVICETALPPMELLDELQKTEAALGRKREFRWGERTIDLDIIFYGGEILSEERLVIPHPDMQNRYFVLRPLLDICPEFVHPVLKKTVKTLFDEL
jgi:2-amino-4-hydroxy-6-hydroxymethyldihydropteridine diphosphokinase